MNHPPDRRLRSRAFTLAAVITTGGIALSLMIAAAVVMGIGARYGLPWSAGEDWPESAKIKSGAIKESSGIVASRRHPGVFWTHNDSGNKPDIFAIHADGTVLRRYRVEGAKNVDWEDIAIDDAGHLYVGDVGDNFQRYETRTIYKLAEPDPLALSKERVQVSEAITFRYPAGRSDCEAVFFLRDKLYVVTKHMFGSAILFRVGEGNGGVRTLEVVCRLPLAAVTAADVSADGKRLAVLGYGYLAVYDLGEDLTELAKAFPKRVTFPTRYQAEACAFDGEDVIITDESRRIWRITAEDIREQRRLPKAD